MIDFDKRYETSQFFMTENVSLYPSPPFSGLNFYSITENIV